MNVLSFEFLGLVGLSSILLWIICHASLRKYALMICNIAFLYLLKLDLIHLCYILGLVLYSFLTGYVLSRNKVRWVLYIFAVIPICVLCYYKYSGYFTGASLIMPLGISFYTFKAVSYIADTYIDKAEAVNPVMVFDYICFFPAFSAGPIHRAQPFFDQLKNRFIFDYQDQKNGCIQAGFGLFEKMVLADALSGYVNAFLSKDLTGWYTVFGVILYAFQIYADFDAYSNTAIGAARMMGFHLERNFYTPYLSASLREFWRRWHISLSSWFRYYIYIPLGGSRKGLLHKWLNTVIVFLVSGLWHGSTMMFAIWGFGHGVLSVIEDAIRLCWPIKTTNRFLARVLYFPGILLNFIIVSVLWVFFRSSTMNEAVTILSSCLNAFHMPISAFKCTAAGITVNELIWIIIMIAMIIITDVLRNFTDMIKLLSRCPFVLRWAVYVVVAGIAIVFGVYGPGYDPQDFIYITF